MGNIDIYHPRRGKFNLCKYYKRDERKSIGTESEWILNNKPAGEFYAKPVSAFNKSGNQTAGVWLSDKSMVTIETEDDVADIVKGCLVLYKGHLYMVNTVQQDEHIEESEFDNESHFTTIIEMRRN